MAPPLLLSARQARLLYLLLRRMRYPLPRVDPLVTAVRNPNTFSAALASPAAFLVV